MSTIRDIKQEQAFQTWKETEIGIINACPRFGKIRVGIKAMEYLKGKSDSPVLIAAPRKDIFAGWLKDFKELGISDRDVEFVTFNSLKHKTNPHKYRLIIIDEIHEASAAQRKEISRFENFRVLGLSGTMTRKTEESLMRDCGLEVLFKYSIEEGVRDGILCDYSITIHQVELDNKHLDYQFKNGGKVTELKYFNVISAQKMKSKNPKSSMFFDLKLTSVIQKSRSKILKTRELLHKFDNKRVLVFTGLTEVATALEIPAYHSKSKDKQLFEDFCEGKGKHMVTIKMMQAGITVKPINIGVVNYTSGNPEDSAQKICRFLGLEYDNLSKKAELHVICSTKEFEVERIKTALMFFDKEKINWIK